MNRDRDVIHVVSVFPKGVVGPHGYSLGGQLKPGNVRSAAWPARQRSSAATSPRLSADRVLLQVGVPPKAFLVEAKQAAGLLVVEATAADGGLDV